VLSTLPNQLIYYLIVVGLVNSATDVNHECINTLTIQIQAYQRFFLLSTTTSLFQRHTNGYTVMTRSGPHSLVSVKGTYSVTVRFMSQ